MTATSPNNSGKPVVLFDQKCTYTNISCTRESLSVIQAQSHFKQIQGK